MLLATLSYSLITNPFLWFLLHRSTITLDLLHRTLSFCIFALWLLFTKVVKLLPHFVLYPTDICFIPATILFGYYHSLIKFWAFLTLRVVSPRNVVLFDTTLTILDYLGQSKGEQQREVGDIVLEGASYLAWSAKGSGKRQGLDRCISYLVFANKQIIMQFESHEYIAIHTNAISISLNQKRSSNARIVHL